MEQKVRYCIHTNQRWPTGNPSNVYPVHTPTFFFFNVAVYSRHTFPASHRVLVNHPGDIWQNTYEALRHAFFSTSIIRTTVTSASAQSSKRTHSVAMAAIHDNRLFCTLQSNSNSNYGNQGVTPRNYSHVALYDSCRSIELWWLLAEFSCYCIWPSSRFQTLGSAPRVDSMNRRLDPLIQFI